MWGFVWWGLCNESEKRLKQHISAVFQRPIDWNDLSLWKIQSSPEKWIGLASPKEERTAIGEVNVCAPSTSRGVHIWSGLSTWLDVDLCIARSPGSCFAGGEVKYPFILNYWRKVTLAAERGRKLTKIMISRGHMSEIAMPIRAALRPGKSRQGQIMTNGF